MSRAESQPSPEPQSPSPSRFAPEIFTFKINAGAGKGVEWRVLSFKGTEAISELFHFKIELASPDSNVDLDDVIGQPCTLTVFQVDRPGGGESNPRTMAGIVRRIEQGIAGVDFTPYLVEMVPTVWTLSQRMNSRIFQNLNVVDIIRKLLKEAKIPTDRYRFALSGTHPPREYCVQYRETNWNFLSRLMEEEGIFYFFEPAGSLSITDIRKGGSQDPEGKDNLVIADSASVHNPYKGPQPLLFRDPSGAVDAEAYIYDFRKTHQMRPGTVAFNDFNFEDPYLDLHRSTSVRWNTELEVYEYPGLYSDGSRAETLAKWRLEAVQATREVGMGRSVCTKMIPGSLFTLDEFPRSDFNQDYLITSVQHEGIQPAEDSSGGQFSYNNTFQCIDKYTPFRPIRHTPKPVIDGSQTAIVTGPDGEEIHTDKYGRVKVKFHWDRSEERFHDNSSCWIRVAQLWTGAGWGAMYIPRIHQEVIVDFLDGDPDRPIITGRVYNGDNPVPYQLDKEKTKSTIMSNSTKGGGGSNEYRFEDLKGSEEIYQHAEKDLTIKTDNDKNQITDHDETLKIGNDRSKNVVHDERVDVGNNRTESVGKDESITIGKNRTENVGENESINIGGNRTTEIKKDETITITGNRIESVKEDETISIEGSRTVEITKEETVSLKKGRTEEVKDDDLHKVEKKFALDAGDEILLKTGDASILMKKDGTIQIKGKDITVTGSGKINVKASGKLVLKGSKIDAN